MSRARKPGRKPMTVAQKKQRSLEQIQREAHENYLANIVPVPSAPMGRNAVSRTGVRRSGLLADLNKVVELAEDMCGGLGLSNIDEWRAWVRAVGAEVEAHLKKLPKERKMPNRSARAVGRKTS